MKIAPIHKPYFEQTAPIVGYEFFCPGCKHKHQIPVVADAQLNGSPYCWQYNANREKPTFQPSINLRTGIYAGATLSTEKTEAAEHWNDFLQRTSVICHFFIIEGKISYCGDTTHEFSGQVVPMLEIAEWPEKHVPQFYKE